MTSGRSVDAADDDHRSLDDARLLLDPAGVRHQERALAGEAEELPVADRVDDAQVAERVPAAALEAGGRPRVERQHDRERKRVELGQDHPQRGVVVDVLGPMERREHEAARLEIELGQPLSALAVVGQHVERPRPRRCSP